AARGRVERALGFQAEAMHVFVEPRLKRPALAGDAGGQAVSDRRRGRELGLLLDEADSQSVATLQRAVVELRTARDDAQASRFARSVTADQTDALAGFHRELRSIEQRFVAERQVGVEESDECHVEIV